MIDCNIIATIGEVLLVAALIGSVVCILIAIRCGSEYICKRHDRDSESLHQCARKATCKTAFPRIIYYIAFSSDKPFSLNIKTAPVIR